MRPPAVLAPDEYGRRAKQLAALASAAGRDPSSIVLSVRAPLYVQGRKGGPPATGERPMFQGTAAEVVADIRAYRAAGVSEVVFDPITPATADLRSVLANLDRFAEDVRPKLR
jgi:alkanesulfonate monooxygenase SsuD/methylene tetrahydromethanopterin reductase-like flavin-dependent oxidoreductase (luciferase family)